MHREVKSYREKWWGKNQTTDSQSHSCKNHDSITVYNVLKHQTEKILSGKDYVFLHSDVHI